MRAFGRTVYRRLEWLELSLDVEQREIEARVPLTAGFLDAASAEELAAFHPELGRSAVNERFARGDRCFGSRYEGRLASASWLSTGTARVEYLRLAVKLPPRTVYHHDRFTDPSLRGLRIAPATGVRLCRALAEEGFVTIVAAVLRENAVAMENALRVGMRQTATIGWVGIGPARHAFRRPSLQ